MNLNPSEPRKKRRVKLDPPQPFPIVFDGKNEWRMYTAHLTDTGSCIIDGDEMRIIHTMGYFGKGSLSRGFPTFGRCRYGAPPIARNRQWIRRIEWLQEVKQLKEESTLEDNDANMDWEKFPIDETSNTEKDICIEGETADCDKKKNDDNDDDDSEKEKVTEKEQSSIPNREEKIDEVCVDSAEDDDVCIIGNEKMKKDESKRINKFTDEEIKIPPDGENNFKEENIELQAELLVLPDSDSENEDYLKNIKPSVESEGFPIRETLHLTPEETFFLLYGLGCLHLINFDGSLFDIDGAWEYFCKRNKHFIQKYVVYHYFRSKGWVVKPGLKYGGEFLLYKQGPPFYHASYIVIIDVVDADSLLRDSSKTMRNMTWNTLYGLNRLSETAAKEVLIAQVLWPSSVPQTPSPQSPEILSEFTVKELLWRRWNPNLTREVICLEEEEQQQQDEDDEEDEDSC